MHRVLSSIVVVLAVLVAGQASGAVIDDNFNSENNGVGVLNYTGFANWIVTGGSVDLIGNGYFDFQPGYGLYVDMDGSTGNAGLMTSVAILPGGDYTLSFDLAGNHRPEYADNETVSVKVALGAVFSENISLFYYDDFQTFTRTFTVPTSTTTAALSFEGIGGDNVGMLLDNVKLYESSQTPPVVPEPATIVIWSLLGLTFAGAYRWRRRHGTTWSKDTTEAIHEMIDRGQ